MHALKLCLWIYVVTQPNVTVFSLMSPIADPSPSNQSHTAHLHQNQTSKTRRSPSISTVTQSSSAIGVSTFPSDDIIVCGRPVAHTHGLHLSTVLCHRLTFCFYRNTTIIGPGSPPQPPRFQKTKIRTRLDPTMDPIRAITFFFCPSDHFSVTQSLLFLTI